MLVSILRLMSAGKASRNFVTRPTQVILPLFPSHGLYSEPKISLDTLSNRWGADSRVNTSVLPVWQLGS